MTRKSNQIMSLMIATRPIDPFSNHRVDPFALTTLTRTFAMHSNCFSFFLSSDLSPVKQRPFSQCTTYALPAGDSPRFYSTASNKLKNRPCSLARPHGPNKISPHHHAFNNTASTSKAQLWPWQWQLTRWRRIAQQHQPPKATAKVSLDHCATSLPTPPNNHHHHAMHVTRILRRWWGINHWTWRD